MACVPAPDPRPYTRAYFSAVTSVYRAVSEDFKPADSRYPTDNFTVRLRPIEAIWGAPPPGPLTLEFAAGTCVDWYLEEDDKGWIANGKEYFVFVAPPGMKPRGVAPAYSQLQVIPASDRESWEAMVLMRQFQITGTGAGNSPPAPPEHTPGLYPKGDPLTKPTLWTRPYPWPWAAGAAGFLFLLGLIIGRALPRRDKQRKSP